MASESIKGKALHLGGDELANFTMLRFFLWGGGGVVGEKGERFSLGGGRIF